MQLYGFWRSLATYRIRIALNLKGVAVSETMIDLDRGDQHAVPFRAMNPMGAVPALVLDDGAVLTQSLAILEWIEETYPTPPLLPQAPADRARIRAMCAITAADSHPLVVPRVQTYLAQTFKADDDARKTWAAHWFRLGLEGYETLLGGATPGAAQGRFCFGDAPTFADCCLASHVAGAQRFGVDIAPYAAVRQVLDTCMALPAFSTAHPSKQPGAPAA